MVLQHVGGIDGKQLVAPDDLAVLVDRADPVAVTVEADADIAAMLRHRALQVDQILGHGRIGVVIGEVAVDLVEQQDMLTRQPRGQPTQNLPGRTIAGIPGDLQRPLTVIVLQQPVDIGVLDIERPFAARAFDEITGGGDVADLLDLVAIDRAFRRHHLDAVVIRRVV